MGGAGRRFSQRPQEGPGPKAKSRTAVKDKESSERKRALRSPAMGLSIPNFTTAAGSGMKAPCAPQYPGPCSAQLDGQVSHPRLAA